jgi:hypothetical protein
MKMLKQLSILALAALVVESQILAEVPGARLLATGAITVNGHQVPESSVLFHGDLVGVGPGSRAVIQEQGLAAYMEPGSQVKYVQSAGKDAIDILSGTGTISLSNSKGRVVFGKLTARPKNSDARITVGAEQHGLPALMASSGDLIVTLGTASMVVPAGSALVQDAPATGTAPAPQPPPGNDTSAAQTQTATTQTQNQDEYCSEENQNKDKNRRKKCAGAVPASQFSGYHLVRDAVIAGAILLGALWGFGAFDSTSTTPCATPPCPLLK